MDHQPALACDDGQSTFDAYSAEWAGKTQLATSIPINAGQGGTASRRRSVGMIAGSLLGLAICCSFWAAIYAAIT